MSKKNEEYIGQQHLFDDGLQPVIDYGTTAKDIDELFTAIRKIASHRETIPNQNSPVKSGKRIVVGKEIEELNIYLKKNLTEAQIKQALTNTLKKILKNKFPHIKYHEGWLGFNGRETWKGGFTQHAPEKRIGLIQDRLDGRTPVTPESVILEIETIKNAGASDISSIFGFFPFHFSSSKFIDHEKTVKSFPLTDQIDAYIKMYTQQDKDERYQKILPTIEKYFKACYARDGSLESLESYKDIHSRIPAHLQEKILIGLDGHLNIKVMLVLFGRDTIKNMIEKIIRQESPYKEQIFRDILNQFFQKIGANQKINDLEQNREKLILLFQEIGEKLKIYPTHIDNFGDFYSMIFSDIVVANIFLHKDGDFDTLREEYLLFMKRGYDSQYKQLIQDIVETCSATDIIETLKSVKHKTAMFMSYHKLNSDKNILNIYKSHLAKDYINAQSIHISKEAE